MVKRSAERIRILKGVQSSSDTVRSSTEFERLTWLRFKSFVPLWLLSITIEIGFIKAKQRSRDLPKTSGSGTPIQLQMAHSVSLASMLLADICLNGGPQ